ADTPGPDRAAVRSCRAPRGALARVAPPPLEIASTRALSCPVRIESGGRPAPTRPNRERRQAHDPAGPSQTKPRRAPAAWGHRTATAGAPLADIALILRTVFHRAQSGQDCSSR